MQEIGSKILGNKLFTANFNPIYIVLSNLKMLPSDTTCVTKNKSLGDRKYSNNCPIGIIFSRYYLKATLFKWFIT